MGWQTVGTWKSLVGEFLRYAVVGGIAFCVDFGTLVACQELVLKSYAWGVYAATVAGFVTGLAANYILSLRFVFIQPKDKGKGRSMGAFAVFGIIGLLGLLLEVEATGVQVLFFKPQTGSVDLDGGGDDAGGLFRVAGEDGIVGEGHVGVDGLGVEGSGIGKALQFLAGGDGTLKAVFAFLRAHERLPIIEGVLAGRQIVFLGDPGGEGLPGGALLFS